MNKEIKRFALQVLLDISKHLKGLKNDSIIFFLTRLIETCEGCMTEGKSPPHVGSWIHFILTCYKIDQDGTELTEFDPYFEHDDHFNTCGTEECKKEFHESMQEALELDYNNWLQNSNNLIFKVLNEIIPSLTIVNYQDHVLTDIEEKQFIVNLKGVILFHFDSIIPKQKNRKSVSFMSVGSTPSY
jgi:hypothetical protein